MSELEARERTDDKGRRESERAENIKRLLSIMDQKLLNNNYRSDFHVVRQGVSRQNKAGVDWPAF